MSHTFWMIVAIWAYHILSYINDYIGKEEERKQGKRGRYDFSPYPKRFP